MAPRSLAACLPADGGPPPGRLRLPGGHPALRPHSDASVPLLARRHPWLLARLPPACRRTAALRPGGCAFPAGILPFGLTALPPFHCSLVAIHGSSLAGRLPAGGR